MAVNSTYYLNAADLATATAVYLDSALSFIAPDGFYGDGTITREQSLGILLDANPCPACGTPCGTAVAASGGNGVYIVNLEVGSDTGAILVRLNPAFVPDGIRVTYDGVVYNKLSSENYGVFQSPNPGHYTIIGTDSTQALQSCGSWYPAGQTQTNNVFLYNPITSSFDTTGTTQTDVISPAPNADFFLVPDALAVEDCYIVIPKPNATPTSVLIEVIGPCGSTGWNLSAACPKLLPSFSSTDMRIKADIPCGEAFTETYYFAKVHSAADTLVGLYDYVFQDAYGAMPLADGYYMTDNVAIPNKVIEVQNGIITEITNCV